MSKSYLPDSDTGLLAWSLNFSTRITATPTAFGLVAGQATSYAALHAAFSTAMAAVDPGERNKSTVATKNTARAALKTSARLLASIVQGQATVTDAQKIDLGLTVRAQPTPIPPPAFAPDVDIVSVSGNTATIRVHDSQSIRRGKPAGVSGCAVFSHVGATPPTEESGWDFQGNLSTTTTTVTFPSDIAPGAKVWFTAYWFNERKQPGPVAAAVGTNIPGGSAMAA